MSEAGATGETVFARDGLLDEVLASTGGHVRSLCIVMRELFKQVDKLPVDANVVGRAFKRLARAMRREPQPGGFRDVGLPEIAEDDPPSCAEPGRYRRGGRLWVAADPDDRAVGYAMARVVDGAGHLDQLPVRPDQQRQGLGRRLVDHVDAWASARGFPR